MPFYRNDNLDLLIVKAINLEAADKNGFSDPFVKISCEPYRVNDVAQEKHKKIDSDLYSAQTNAIPKTLDPDWKEHKRFVRLSEIDEGLGIIVKFEVFDFNIFTKNKFLGRAQLHIDPNIVGNDNSRTVTFHLQDCSRGMLTVNYCVTINPPPFTYGVQLKPVQVEERKVAPEYQESEVPSETHPLVTHTPFEFVKLHLPSSYSLDSHSIIENVFHEVNFSSQGKTLKLTLWKPTHFHDIAHFERKFVKLCNECADPIVKQWKTDYTKVKFQYWYPNKNEKAKNKLIFNFLEREVSLSKGDQVWRVFYDHFGLSNGYMLEALYMEEGTEYFKNLDVVRDIVEYGVEFQQ